MTKRTSALTGVVLLFTLLTPFLVFTHALAADKKVAVLPLALYADPSKDYLRQGIKSMLASRLSGEGLQVLGDQALAPFLRQGEEEKGITSSDRAKELAELLKADYAIYGSVTVTGTGYSLDLSILDRTKEVTRGPHRRVASAASVVDAAAHGDRLDPLAQSPRPIPAPLGVPRSARAGCGIPRPSRRARRRRGLGFSLSIEVQVES